MRLIIIYTNVFLLFLQSGFSNPFYQSLESELKLELQAETFYEAKYVLKLNKKKFRSVKEVNNEIKRLSSKKDCVFDSGLILDSNGELVAHSAVFEISNYMYIAIAPNWQLFNDSANLLIRLTHLEQQCNSWRLLIANDSQKLDVILAFEKAMKELIHLEESLYNDILVSLSPKIQNIINMKNSNKMGDGLIIEK